MAQQFTYKDSLNDFFEKLKQELLIDLPTTFYFILAGKKPADKTDE